MTLAHAILTTAILFSPQIATNSFLIAHVQASALPQTTGFEKISLIAESATKRVLVPHDSIGSHWREEIQFEDSTWQLCEGEPGGVGYKKKVGYEQLITLDGGEQMHADGGHPNTSCLIRTSFFLTGEMIEKIVFLLFEMRFDDGFAA